MIFQSLQSTQTDILMMNETGKCWHKVKEQDRWNPRTRGWWESSKSTISYNTQDVCSTAYQPGGCLITSINKSSHRVLNCGVDERKLGRWAWQRFSGKRGITLLVISAYRPCKPSTAGPNTTYAQHQRYLDTVGVQSCPRQCILDDLGNFIDTNRTAGDQIILGMDCNEDVTSDLWLSWLRKRGLRNGITPNHSKSPSTYHRGSYPIDGIFISSTLTIRQSGYLPFGYFPSDHRGLWIDISYVNAFGYTMTNVVIPSARRLKTGDPRVVNKFNTEYIKFIKYHKLHSKMFQLEQDMHKVLTPHQQQQYENILEMRNKGILLAESRCRKLRMGMVPYSNELNTARMTIQLWRAVIVKKRGCRYSNNKLRRLERATGQVNSLHESMESAICNEKKAYKEYRRLKKVADQKRVTYLEDKAQAIALNSSSPKANIYKQLILREQQRTSARKIKATIGKLRSGGVTRVEVINADGGVDEVITKEGIEKACMAENDAKFQQTNDTPFMQAALVHDVKYDALTEAGTAILHGTYQPPPETSQYTRELIQHLQLAKSNQPSPIAEITPSMFSQGWKRMKEQTSAGISGLHFGHLKACAQNSFLTEFESSLSHIPFASGYSPNPWQYGVNVMIRKKAQVDLVTGLRTVVLTEADFNFNNKTLGKMTLEHAEKTGMLAKEQYGSRKGKRAIDQAIHKRSTYDILRQFRAPGALCSNDAKSCYDRIVHSVAMLAYRRLGIPFPPVQCMLHTIQNMKHHIRTTFGDSTFTLSNDGSLVPYQGALQGNGASPATWVVISTSLLDMMRAAGNGGHFIEPISGHTSHTVGFAFVDDTDLIELDLRQDDITTADTMEKMQAAISRWEGGLRATGGAIVPKKSWVYPISFAFNSDGRWKYETVQEIGASFSVCDHNGVTSPLQQYDPHVGRETLGVILAPDGNNQAMIEELMTKANEWKDHIRTGFLTASDAHQALHTTILKTLQYPLPALTLTEKDCDKIMAPILEVSLPSMSVCRRYPRKIVYAPKEEGGLNIPNLYITQGTSRIAFLQEHLGANTLSGELLRVTIEAAKVEIGIGRNIFQLDYSSLHGLLTDTWVKDVWKFSHEHHITINDHVTQNVPLQRENDLYLMEVFSRHTFTISELQHINRVRIHLQVTTLSDIMCGYGTTFTQAYRIQLQQGRPSRCKWPHQPKPGQKSISLWRRALRECFPREIDNIYTLGHWLHDGHEDDWQWYYNISTHHLYERKHVKWKVWSRVSQRGILGNTPLFRYYNDALRLPKNSSRATILQLSSNKVRLTGWFHHHRLEKERHTPYYLDRSMISDSTMLSLDEKRALGHHINTGQITLISDGSFSRELQLGTASWVLESIDRKYQVTGSLVTPGEADTQCSHRSELSGLLGGIHYVNDLCQSLGIIQGSATIGCDGEGAITMVSRVHDKVNSNRSHFDLLGAIHSAIGDSPIKWSFVHVKGHQDDFLDYTELSRNAQLNVLSDNLAKQKLSRFATTVNWRYKRPIHIPYERCSVDWNNQFGTRVRISCHLQKMLQTQIQGVNARDYWKKKKRITNYQERQIDWDLLKKSHKSMETHRHRWLSKWLTGFCGTGIMLQRYRHQTHSNCPRCGISGESAEHIIQCQEKDAKELWHNAIKLLEEWMLSNQGHPELVQVICTNLRNWQLMFTTLPAQAEDANVNLAITQQQRIGWLNFIQGYISRQWRQCQADYLLQIRSQKSPLLWMARLQKKVWLIVWDMWGHRNRLLHGAGDRIHVSSMRDIDSDIKTEWSRGMDNLPLRYAHLFSGSFDTLLLLSHQDKQRWLTSVWSARDKLNGGIQIYDRSSNLHYDKWKAGKKPSSPPDTTPKLNSTTTKPNLVIDTLQPLDDEATTSDDDSVPGLGSTPRASYNFTSDDYVPKDSTSQQSSLTTTSLDSHIHPTGTSSTNQASAFNPKANPTHHCPIQSTLTIPVSSHVNLQDFINQQLPSDTIISRFGQQQVSFHSLQTTTPRTWLNDEIINFYLAVLTHGDNTQKEGTTRLRNHYFNSFFFTQLLDEGRSNQYCYRNVMRWSRRVYGSDLFGLQRIFVPCNISQSHWSCVIADMTTHKITYFDSMRGIGDKYLHSMLHYIQDDWRRTRGFDMPDIRQWTLNNERDVPQQTNSYDCGAFVCLFATCMFLDQSMDFTQSDAGPMRRKLAHLTYEHRIPDPMIPTLVTQSQHDTRAPNHSTIAALKTPGDSHHADLSDNDIIDMTNSGYNTIMKTSNRMKRKLAHSGPSKRSKRKTGPPPNHSRRICDTVNTTNPIQQSLLQMTHSSTPKRTKRRLNITDEEHPFKHKRFKSDSNE